MMVPKRSLLAASAALLCFGTVASAQGQHTQKIRRVTKPLIQADLDLSTGKYTIGSKVNQKAGDYAFNTSRTLSNLDFAGFVGIDSIQCEWIDTWDKTGSGKSEVMTSFLFAYCSTARATMSGGVGGSAAISFIEGYTTPATGAPRPAFSSRAAVFNISGLPANTAQSSFFGGFNCFVIRVNLQSPNTNPQLPNSPNSGGACLADGVVGWGWDFRDLSLFVPLADTFPFLACVTSCSGAGPDGQGMTNGVDQFCSSGGPGYNLFASFTFSTVTTYTSMSMEVREANAVAGATAVYNPSGTFPPNPSILTQAGSPGLGEFWKMSLDCSGANPGLAVFVVEFLPTPITPGTTPFAPNDNTLVAIAPAPIRKVFLVGHSGGTVTFPPGGPGVPLPCDMQYMCATWQMQAFCGNPGPGDAFLSNGLNETMGSF